MSAAQSKASTQSAQAERSAQHQTPLEEEMIIEVQQPTVLEKAKALAIPLGKALLGIGVVVGAGFGGYRYGYIKGRRTGQRMERQAQEALQEMDRIDPAMAA